VPGGDARNSRLPDLTAHSVPSGATRIHAIVVAHRKGHAIRRATPGGPGSIARFVFSRTHWERPAATYVTSPCGTFDSEYQHMFGQATPSFLAEIAGLFLRREATSY